MIFEASMHVQKYLYVDLDTIAQKVSMHHVRTLLEQCLELFLDAIVHGYLGALP